MRTSTRLTMAMAAIALHGAAAPLALAREPQEIERPEVEQPATERGEAESPEREQAETAQENAERESRAENGAESELAAVEQVESAAERIDMLAREERPDRDEAGFPVRRGEIGTMDIAPDALATLLREGFGVIARTRLAMLDHELIRLSPPPGMRLRDARARIVALDPAATVDLVHYYGLGLSAGGKPRRLRGAAPDQPRGTGSGAARVGMIDTAVAGHPALGNTRVAAWPQGQWPGAPVGHGTAVASILAQGGVPDILAANIFRGNAARPFTSAEVVADALEWMVGQAAPVINMSLAGPRDAVLDKLVAAAQARGAIIVAAAGNGGPAAAPAYPAALPGVIAVTAVDKAQRVYRYANQGPYVTVAALGVDVAAANAAGGLARFSGTSFATPRVAAWLGRCRAGGASATQCRDRLQRAARDLGPAGRDDAYGFGLVD